MGEKNRKLKRNKSNAHAVDIPHRGAKEARLATSLIKRKILEEASNIEDVERIIRSNLPYTAMNILVTSKHERKSVVFEITPDTCEKYVSPGKFCYSTNHFRSPVLQYLAPGRKWGTYDRLASMKALTEDGGDISPEEAIRILKNTNNGIKRHFSGHSLTNEGTFQSFVFDLSQNVIWISNGKKLPVALSGDFVPIPAD